MPARKRMIITGVSSGIGLAVAAEALRLGWHVEGIGRNAPTLLTEHSRGAFTRCDLSDRASLKGLSLVSDQSFDLTVLVNNAGTLGPVKPSYKASWEEIDHCITLNTSSAMLLSANSYRRLLGRNKSISQAPVLRHLPSKVGVLIARQRQLFTCTQRYWQKSTQAIAFMPLCQGK